MEGVADLEKELQPQPASADRISKTFPLVSKNSRIALVMDDLSRPTPVAKLLPAVLDELKRGGVDPQPDHPYSRSGSAPPDGSERDCISELGKESLQGITLGKSGLWES